LLYFYRTIVLYVNKYPQTPILCSHGQVDRSVTFEARQAASSFIEKIGVGCEFKVNLRAITKTALSSVRHDYGYYIVIEFVFFIIFLSIFNALQSLKLLSVMATIRLEDDDIDNIDKVLVVALVDSSLNSNATRSMTMVASLASSS